MKVSANSGSKLRHPCADKVLALSLLCGRRSSRGRGRLRAGRRGGRVDFVGRRCREVVLLQRRDPVFLRRRALDLASAEHRLPRPLARTLQPPPPVLDTIPRRRCEEVFRSNRQVDLVDEARERGRVDLSREPGFRAREEGREGWGGGGLGQVPEGEEEAGTGCESLRVWTMAFSAHSANRTRGA